MDLNTLKRDTKRHWSVATLGILLVTALLCGCGDEDDASMTPAADGMNNVVGNNGGNNANNQGDNANSGDNNAPANNAPENNASDNATTGNNTGANNGAGGEPVIEGVTLTTEDGKSIAATYTHPGGDDVPVAGLVLVHGLGGDRARWDGFVVAAHARGLATIAIDLRGHGDSDPAEGGQVAILSDPDQAPLDVKAAVAYLVEAEGVDGGRLAVVGESVGANLSVVASALNFGVVAAVPLSPRYSAVSTLAGSPDTLEVGPVFCLAGETDGAGAQAATCQTLIDDATDDASQLEILPGSGAHGLAILREMPELEGEILDWLEAQLAP